MKKLFLRVLVSFFVLLGMTSLMANTKVDIIFVMDTSGSLDNEAPALISATQTVSEDLIGIYDLQTKLWSITNQFDFSNDGFDSSVIDEIPNGTVNQYEDWGPATYDIATQYSGWRTGAIKIVIPISDEGPEDGDNLYQDDKDVIDKARIALDATDIYAVPVIAQSWQGNDFQDTLYKGYGLILSDKAIKTGSGDLVEQFKTIIADIVAEASGISLGSVSAIFEENFVGGKLVIDAKGASRYDVVIKFDGVEILNTTTSKSTISITYPKGYDDTVTHMLDIDYTVYAIDDSAQVLEQKNQAFSYEISSTAKTLVSNYSKARTETVAKEPIFLSSNNKVDNKIKSFSAVADPVDVSSGNFEFSHNDLVMKTAGVPLVIKRNYNSLESMRGWKFNIINTMDISDINNIKVIWNDGDSEDLFIKAKEGWVSVYSTDTLTTESGAYVVTKSSGNKYKFDINGKLIAITDKQNLGLLFEYSGTNIIVKDSFQNLLATIVLNSSNQITSITDRAGSVISYAYSGSNIISYTNRNGDTESYEYSGDLIKTVKGADGKIYVSNVYDAQGRVISQLNGSGNKTTFDYYGDLANLVVEKTEVTYADGVTRMHTFNLLLPTSIEGSGTTVAFEYDANNKVKTVTDTNGKVWAYERNTAGLVTKSTDPQGNTTLYEYDDHNNIVSNINTLGQKVTFEYDANDNLIKAIDADSKVTIYEYNANNQIVKIINPLGNEITYTYNNIGQVEKTTLPNGATSFYTYNALGDVKSITDALNRVVKYEYDKEGKVTKVTNPMNFTTVMNYDAFGDLIKITDAKNRSITMEYNVDGLLTKTTLVDGTTVETTYDVLGRVIATKDVLGRESKQEYDDFGRVFKVIDPEGNEFLIEYDNVGNVVKAIDAKGKEAETKYDELYRPFKSIDANGVEVATTDYNAYSMPTKVEDATGRTIEFGYDILNRLEKSTLSGSLSAEAVYDALGRIIQTSDPKGEISTYAYDSMGNIVKETNPLAKETLYSYDILGRVISTLTPNGVTSSFTYDDLDRVIEISQTKGIQKSNTSYTYDEVGNILTLSDEYGKITYTYNVNDQVATRTDIFGNTVSYGYDKAKRLTTLTYPDGRVVTYGYDKNNNLLKVTDWADRETSYEYDTNGNLQKATYPNGAYTMYSYDNNSRLVTLSNYAKNSKLISTNELTRNEVGDITKNKDTNPAMLDLTKVKNFNFEVNAFNQITKSDEGDFIYDDNGNLLSYKYDGKNITLEYDLSDRLIKATIGSDVYSYTYDAEGNRVAVNGKHYLVDNVMGLSKPLAELDSSNSISKYYIWTNGLGYSVNATGEILVYLYDYQGNTNAVLDMSNKLKASYRYTAYGAVISADSGLDNPFKYLGEHGIMSDNSALYYVRARYYSPELSRWTQADLKRGSVANPLSLNRYVLNEGDVVNYVDISGYERGKNSKNDLNNDSLIEELNKIPFKASGGLVKNVLDKKYTRNSYNYQDMKNTIAKKQNWKKLTSTQKKLARSKVNFNKKVFKGLDKAGKAMTIYSIGNTLNDYRTGEINEAATVAEVGTNFVPVVGVFDSTLAVVDYAMDGAVPEDALKGSIRVLLDEKAKNKYADKGINYLESVGVSQQCLVNPESCGWSKGTAIFMGAMSAFGAEEW